MLASGPFTIRQFADVGSNLCGMMLAVLEKWGDRWRSISEGESTVCENSHENLPWTSRCITCGQMFNTWYGPYQGEPVTRLRPPARADTRWAIDTLHWSLRRDRWKCLEEVEHRTDYPSTHLRNIRKPGRRADLLGIRAPSQPEHGLLERLTVEVKVSRSDFLRDVRQPDKQAAWRALSHWHAFAAPAGLIRPAELPDGSGLLELWDDGERGTAVWQVLPCFHEAPEVPGWLVHEFATRASWHRGSKKSLYELAAD